MDTVLIDSNNTCEKWLKMAKKWVSMFIFQTWTLLDRWRPVWLVNAEAGAFGTDYLFRATVTHHGFSGNIAQEALYPTTFTDNQGKPLSGNSSYLMHFEPGQTPLVYVFWSITMYNDKGNFVDNPINRYLIGTYTKGLKNNTDGSLDIYLQNTSPGADKESSWLPAPEGAFSMFMRLYLPQPQVLNGSTECRLKFGCSCSPCCNWYRIFNIFSNELIT